MFEAHGDVRFAGIQQVLGNGQALFRPAFTEQDHGHPVARYRMLRLQRQRSLHHTPGVGPVAVLQIQIRHFGQQREIAAVDLQVSQQLFQTNLPVVHVCTHIDPSRIGDANTFPVCRNICVFIPCSNSLAREKYRLSAAADCSKTSRLRLASAIRFFWLKASAA